MGIGYRIRDLREKRGWTQAELADKSGIPQSTISGMERAATSDPRAATLHAVAAALGVEAVELLDEPAPNGPRRRDRGLAEIEAIYDLLPPAGRSALLETGRALRAMARDLASPVSGDAEADEQGARAVEGAG